jgi:hypothetical protein
MTRTKPLILLAGCIATIVSISLASAFTSPLTRHAADEAPAEKHLRNITQLTFGGETLKLISLLMDVDSSSNQHEMVMAAIRSTR